VRVRTVMFAACFLVTPLLPAQSVRRQGAGTASLADALSPKAVEAGQALFERLCSGCHGARGEGGQGEGRGPNLMNSWEVRRATNVRLAGFIRNGVPGSAMPSFALPGGQIGELVAFVRSLNSPAISVPVAGDPAAGRVLFFGHGGCADCHMIRGRGGFLGPDLSDAGATEHLDDLRQALLAPGSLSREEYWPVILKTADGKSIEGVAKNRSNWSIQVLDKNGGLHLVRGAAMKRVTFKSGTWMPGDYSRRLTAREIQDLLAFLSRQSVRPSGGEQPANRHSAPLSSPE
jgi:putative heme-binding domain-containing protein